MRSINVYLGVHSRNNDTKKLFHAEKIIVHPKYYPGEIMPADIALIKLRNEIKFNEIIMPICLPTRGTINYDRFINFYIIIDQVSSSDNRIVTF